MIHWLKIGSIRKLLKTANINQYFSTNVFTLHINYVHLKKMSHNIPRCFLYFSKLYLK